MRAHTRQPQVDHEILFAQNGGYCVKYKKKGGIGLKSQKKGGIVLNSRFFFCSFGLRVDRLPSICLRCGGEDI
jgi:hypothetical protein